MPSLTALARQARLAPQDVEWLHALVSDWQLLADLSFADLVLWVNVVCGFGWVSLGVPGNGALRYLVQFGPLAGVPRRAGSHWAYLRQTAGAGAAG